MKKDTLGLINKYSYLMEIRINRFCCTLITYLIFRFKGIKMKKDCRFIGFTKAYRAPETYISIGSNCIFRSKRNSNFIGINRSCMISTLHDNAKIEIGNFCGFSGTVIGAFKRIKLGNNVRCGSNTLITDSDWHIEDNRTREFSEVIIGDNVWLGEGVKVLKGVTIGTNSIIGAGSVVTKNVPANVIACGNPCFVIKSL